MRGLYTIISKSTEGQQFLKDITDKSKGNLRGIIFEDNILVPIENIKIYWSNKGQSNCNQLRLSIRFKIINQNNTYVYNPKSNELELNTNPITNTSFSKILCY